MLDAGWLVFFTILDMITKLIGAYMSWGLRASVQSGEKTGDRNRLRITLCSVTT